MGAGPCDVVDDGGDDDDDESAAKECAPTNVQCTHSLDVDILLAGSDEYPAGMYTFQVVAPDETVFAIDCHLPRADVGLECTGGNIEELVAWMDIQDYTTMHFHVNGAPPYCELSVLYNDDLLIRKVIEPDYDLSYPNGESCDPVCYSGEEAVAVAIF